MTWAQRLKRVFQIAIETCPDCGGTRRVFACTRHGFTRALLGLRPNRTLILACTRHGFTRALLGLRPNRTLILACADDPPLIRTLLTQVQRRAALTAAAPRGPPDSQPVLSRI
jgi:hypothetical protein